MDPHLGALVDNGGPTFTHALLAGSPAIDAGSCTDIDGDAITIDQRGMTRPYGLGCDIGPFEGETFPYYFPIVVKPPLAEAVVTDRGETIGYPTYWWVYGYVSSLVSTPIYSVTVGIDITYFPYCEPNPCEPYKKTEIVKPAFAATLPGQINPFSWSLMLGKAYATVGQVKVVSASLIGESGITYHPITVLNWRREDKAVVGRIRNDSGKNLGNVRVVIVSNQCAWQEATLTIISLQPGQETDFRLETFYCEGDDVVVIGQGSSDH